MVYPEIQNREGKLIEYPIRNDETILEATVEAFEAIDFDVFDEETTIEKWVGDCGMNQINWDSEITCRLTTMIWEYPIVITSESITIFSPRGE